MNCAVRFEAENDTLREEVRALKRALMEAGEPPSFLGLTNAELAMSAL